jgi:methylaspartate mutase epsilon subunit
MPETSQRIDEERFLAARPAVLSQWRTGADVDLDEAVVYCRQLSPAKSTARKRAAAKESGDVLVQPLAGFPALGRHIELMQHLQDAGGADILPTQIDSQTRTLQFESAQRALEISERTGEDKLNGFPIVNHGVEGTRKLVESVAVPIEMRIGTVEPRLAAEVAFASGVASMTAGPIYYTVHYSSRVSFAEAIRSWQYVFRLIGWYTERGVPLGLQIHGVGNSTPFPNTLLGVCCALECLIAAAQGCRSFSVDARFMGNLVQDVAAARVIPEICDRYLRAAGYDGFTLTVDRKSWAGRYPEDTARAYGLVSYNAVSGMIAGVNEFITNSIEEGVGIPLKEANSATLRAYKQIIAMMRIQSPDLETEALALETDMMRREMTAILDAVLALGEGDPVLATCRGFEAGLLDVPFAATRNCLGEVVVLRDDEGAVRYLDAGRLPLPDEVRAYHRACLDRRVSRLGRDVTYEDIVDDIFSISRGYLAR